jgi:hypothetical protein
MYKKRIERVLSELLSKIRFTERKDKVFPISKAIIRIKPDAIRYRAKSFIDIFEICFVIFGEYGEMGKAIFLNEDMDVVIKVCFEDADIGETICFILDDKVEED